MASNWAGDVVLGIGSSQPPVERRRISVELRVKIV
jgi:hypothetical protein